MTDSRLVDREAAEKLIRDGQPSAVVAEKLGCSKRTVERIRKDLGVTSHRRPFTADELERIDALLADGASVVDALRTVGRGDKSWTRRFVGRGWTREQRAEFMTARRLAKRAGVEL